MLLERPLLGWVTTSWHSLKVCIGIQCVDKMLQLLHSHINNDLCSVCTRAKWRRGFKVIHCMLAWGQGYPIPTSKSFQNYLTWIVYRIWQGSLYIAWIISSPPSNQILARGLHHVSCGNCNISLLFICVLITFVYVEIDIVISYKKSFNSELLGMSLFKQNA